MKSGPAVCTRQGRFPFRLENQGCAKESIEIPHLYTVYVLNGSRQCGRIFRKEESTCQICSTQLAA